MSDFEARKKELLQPLFFEAGAALMDCQSFEFGIALLLYHFSRLEANGLDPEKVSLILEDRDKRTAGQLVWTLKKHLTVSEGIEAALEEALTARNRLIHKVLVDNIEKLPEQSTRAALVKEVRVLRSKVQQADKMLRPFIMGFSAALDGLDHGKLEEELKRRLS